MAGVLLTLQWNPALVSTSIMQTFKHSNDFINVNLLALEMWTVPCATAYTVSAVNSSNKTEKRMSK